MDAKSACNYINEKIHYKKGWTISATLEDRFDSSIRLHIEFEAPSWDQEYAPDYEVSVWPHREQILPIWPDTDEFQLELRVFQQIMEVEHHEAREAFRIGPDFHAPFHPHKLEGMKAWGNPEADIKFGAV